MRRATPQVGTVVKALVDEDERLLRTPRASDGVGGALGERIALERGNSVGIRDQIMDLVSDQGLPVSRAELNFLPTPTLGHIRNHDEPVDDYLQRRQDFVDGRTKGMPGASLGVAVRMETLPTPTTRDWKDSQAPHERNGVVQTDTVARAVFNSGEVQVLPTPLVDDAKNTGHNQTRIKTLASEVWDQANNGQLLPTLRASDGYERRNQKTMDKIAAEGGDMTMPTLARTTTNWGKFEPAIRRWEALTRPAPAPTNPDGKDGNHRLSSKFTEWMMGLPDGWVTGHGLKRNDELKMCGNGVVPQQAELALRFLLGQTDIPKA